MGFLLNFVLNSILIFSLSFTKISKKKYGNILSCCKGAYFVRASKGDKKTPYKVRWDDVYKPI